MLLLSGQCDDNRRDEIAVLGGTELWYRLATMLFYSIERSLANR